MAKQDTQPPLGTRDFLPADARRRAHVVSVVRDVFERLGFEPLETPAIAVDRVMPAEIGQRFPVDDGAGRRAETALENILGVGPGDRAHGVEAHAEAALQMFADAAEIP